MFKLRLLKLLDYHYYSYLSSVHPNPSRVEITLYSYYQGQGSTSVQSSSLLLPANPSLSCKKKKKFYRLGLVKDMETLPILILSSLLVYILVRLISFLYKVWWRPLRTQKFMSSQGIRGPPYQFFHGNNKQMLKMKREAMEGPMELTHDILPRVQPHIHLWMKSYGKIFLTWEGCKPQLVMTDPDLIKEVLNNRNGVYEKGKPTDYMKMLLGDGLVTADGVKWSRQRKLANHAFHMENLKGMVPAIISSVESMLERWGYHEKKEIEVLEEFKILASDVISKTAFGSNYLEGQKIFAMLTKLSFIVAANLFERKLPVIGKLINYKDNIEAEKLDHGIRESFMQIVNRRKEMAESGEIEDSNRYGSDYLGLLVHANQETDESKRISIEDMIDECKTFYFAGHETTMGLLAWTMFLLATHTDWQEKARGEVFSLFGRENPSADGIAKMKTMTMIINETLRLYPPVLAIYRQVECDVKLGDILLPAGTAIVMPTLTSHKDPQIWGEDVHSFRPDRFSQGVAKAAKNTNAYFPFSMGPRICVGLNLATLEAKLALSMILQRYAFTLSPSYIHSPVEHLFTRPQHGVQIIFHAL